MMKRRLLSLSRCGLRPFGPIGLVLLLLAPLSTCRRFDNPFDPANNRPPDVPTDPFPPHGANRQDTVGLVLSWTGTDPDSAYGDSLVYDIHFGTTSPPPLVAADRSADYWPCASLGVGVTYYWRIVARDTRDDTTAGPVWSFTTNPNLPPYEPSSPYPANGAAGLPTGITLAWQGGDPNPGDSVVYDVYLGTTSPPPLFAAGVPGPELAVTGLDHRAAHYWQVVARDQDSAETSGPVWQFSTLEAVVFISPAAGDTWPVGSRRRIQWSGGTDDASPDPGPVRPRDSRARTLRPARVPADGPARAKAGGVARSSPPVRRPVPPAPLLAALSADSAVLHLSPDGGASWQRIDRVTTPGEYEWTVTGPAAADARIQLRIHAGPDAERATSASFVVYDTAGPTPPVITSPAGGETWEIGSEHDITWTGGANGVDSSVVYSSADDGETWQRQGMTLQPGRFGWTVPGPASESARVLVRAHYRDGYVSGQSNRFAVLDTIGPTPPVITSPAGGETWEIGSEHDITWTGGTNGVDSSVVYSSADDGETWQRQGMTLQPGRFGWTVPGPASESARVRVRAWYSGQALTGVSNRFRIVPADYPDTVIATVPVGGRPAALAWNARDNRVYVANRDDATVSVIDGATNQVIATIPVDRSPSALAWDAVHNKVYCTNEGARSVSVIDGAADTVIATVPVGAVPRAVAVNPADGKVYVANYGTGANSVTVIDGAADTVIATVPVGERPVALAWNPLGSRVYVACFTGSSVWVIDGETNAVLDSIRVGWSPAAVAVVEDRNHVYVANSGTGSNSVTVINAADNTVITSVDVAAKPVALAWNPESNRVYVACEDGASVWSIRTADQRVAEVIGLGAGPVAVKWYPGVNMAYVASRISNEVTIIDGATNTRAKVLEVGAGPAALTLNRRDNRVYVADSGDDTVTVIGTE